MEKKLKENVGFYAMGILAVIIAVLGITANVLCKKTGGYALGAGVCLVVLLCEFFVFAISPTITKTRTKGILFVSSFLIFIYSILFFVCDIVHVKAFSYAFENGVYVTKTTGLGKFAVVFEVFCMIILFFLFLRMILNLFGKEIKFYEKLLGTQIVRYKENPDLTLDLPEKDTDKLVITAQRALSSDKKLLKNIQNSVEIKDETKQQTETKTEFKPQVNKKDEHKQQIKIQDKPYEQQQNDNNSAPILNKQTCSSTQTVENKQDIAASQSVDEKPIYTANEKPTYAPIQTSEEEQNFITNKESSTESKDDADDITPYQDYTDNSEIVVNEDINNEQDVEIAIDPQDVGGVILDYEQREDYRNPCIIHHITEQVDNKDDDIYSNFNYDDDV